MITINTRTKAVTLDPDTPVMARNQFGNATYGYVRGWIEPNYPMPAIPLEAKWFSKAKTRDETLCILWNTITRHCFVAWWSDGTRD